MAMSMASKPKIKTVRLSFIQDKIRQKNSGAEDENKDEDEDEEGNGDDEEFLQTLPEVLQQRLFDHQRKGVSWLYQKFKDKSGGILGDDMGLGKTFQVTTLLTGLLCRKEIKRVLIICPVSVTQSWSRELRDHAKPYSKGLKVDILNSEMPKKTRERTLREIFMVNKPRVVITTYTLFTNMVDHFSQNGKWDYCILDEGHTIKNPSTKMNKACHDVEARHRLILSGTPIQNNMMELHALISWITKGKLLGSAASFKFDYADPIM
jgi:SNF2 family DNA or RNA helicase